MQVWWPLPSRVRMERSCCGPVLVVWTEWPRVVHPGFERFAPCSCPQHPHAPTVLLSVCWHHKVHSLMWRRKVNPDTTAAAATLSITSAPDPLMWLNHRSFSRDSISPSATCRSLNRPQLNAGGFLQSKPFWPASHYRGQLTLAPHSGRTWHYQALTVSNKHGIFINWHKSFDNELYYRLNTEYFCLSTRHTPSLQCQSPTRTITAHITINFLAVSTVTWLTVDNVEQIGDIALGGFGQRNVKQFSA